MPRAACLSVLVAGVRAIRIRMREFVAGEGKGMYKLTPIWTALVRVSLQVRSHLTMKVSRHTHRLLPMLVPRMQHPSGIPLPEQQLDGTQVLPHHFNQHGHDRMKDAQRCG